MTRRHTQLLAAVGVALATLTSCSATAGSHPRAASPTPVRDVNRPVSVPDVDCAVDRCIALTYDDGPGPYTSRLLDELSVAGAPATFFMLGRNAKEYPKEVARAARLGMVVADHTWDHQDLTRLSKAKQRQEVDSTAQLLERLSGNPVTLLRPPYGAYDAAVRRLGMAVVLWTVDTQDWKNRNAATTTKRARAGARPGAILLMHDIHPTTVTATPGIIAALRKEGYTLVTVPQLLGTTTPGTVYNSGPTPSPSGTSGTSSTPPSRMP